jgi:HK97 family phage portal protein
MGFFSNLFNRESKAAAVPTQNLPIPLQASGVNYLSAIGLRDLYANLSRRLPGSQKDWVSVAGDIMLNSIVAISMDFFIRAYSEARPMVYRLIPGSETEYEKDPNHPMLALLANPQYGLAPSRFWSNVIIDYKTSGNVYIRKIRKSTNGPVIGLQFLPYQTCAPQGDGKNPLTHYNYMNDGQIYSIKLQDMIHIAYARDPEDMRLGRSPLMSTLREIATDNQTSSTSYGMMKNSGLPSLLVGPDATDQAVDVSDDDLRTLKKRLQDSFTGDNAGSVAVMSGPFKVEKVSHTPSDMAFDVVRHTPEERITAALGLNCLVLNLSAGLQNSTYNNLQEATQNAWDNGVIPLLRVIAESITQELLPEFPETIEGDFFDFDLSDIKALKDDSYKEAQKAELLYKAGIIDRAEAKRLVGYDYNPTDEQIYHPDSTPLFITTQNPNGDPIKNFLDVNVKKKSSYEPNQTMVNNARRALRWKDDGFDGGTRIGLARANQIVNRDNLSEETVVRMFSFFSRHEVDKKASGFYQGSEGYPSNGRVAWDLWGGDAGFTWSRNIVQKLKDEEE